MGVCYIYLNLDRKEYFNAGALGGGMKSSALGRNLEGRALGLLLKERSAPARNLIEPGAWAGCRIAAVGDSDEPTKAASAQTAAGGSLYRYAHDHCRDIAADVALMMLNDDAGSLLESAVGNDKLFILLGDLANIHRRANVERALRERFGADWVKRYGQKRRQRGGAAPPL